MNGADLTAALTFARRHTLFASLDDEAFSDIAERARFHELDAGESLFRQGEKADRFFLVMSGAVKVFRLSADGQEKIIEVIETGHSLTEAVMFLDKPNYPANAQAISHCGVLSFHNQSYKSLLMNSPDCCFKVMGALAMRLHKRLNEIEMLTTQNARHRVRHFLCELLPEDCGDQSRVTLPVAKRLIAAKLAMQPETFSRIMFELKGLGVLEVHGRELRICNVSGLRNFN